MLENFQEQGAKDLKTFTQVLNTIANMLAMESSDDNRKLLKYTADNSMILETIFTVLDKCKGFSDTEVIFLISKVVLQISLARELLSYG